MQALESVLNNYRIRHAQCVSSTTLPGKYIVMSMADDYAGLGNQFPSVITGDRPTRDRSSVLPYSCHVGYATSVKFKWPFLRTQSEIAQVARVPMSGRQGQCMAQCWKRAAVTTGHPTAQRRAQNHLAGALQSVNWYVLQCCRFLDGAGDRALLLHRLPILPPGDGTRAGLQLGEPQGAPAGVWP